MKTSVVIAEPGFTGSTAPLIGTIEDVSAKAAEIGFNAVQLTVCRPEDIDVRRISHAAGANGIRVSGMATGQAFTRDGLFLGSEDEDIRKACVRRMKQFIDIGSELNGADVIIGTIRGKAALCRSREGYLDQFRRSMSELVPYAEKQQIRMMLESCNHVETDIFLSVPEVLAIQDEFPSESFCLQLDTMHMLMEHRDTEKEVLAGGSRIRQVDISDENRMAPDGKHFDYPLLMKLLKKVGFHDYFVFEFRCSPPENAAKVGFDYIRKLGRDSGL